MKKMSIVTSFPVYDVYSPFEIVNIANSVQKEIDGNWYPCRPTPYPSFWNRVKMAWLVLTGKIDGVRWYKQ